ncbi:MAG TPA: hypothetical protein VHF22_13155, partial [Planctomycetota bacterium]|nr:hypothetical protein [Planctomycetota bacterium]
MSFTPKDKLFIAAAKKLGTLTDDQLKDCLAVAVERRKLGVDKDLADVALDRGYLSPEKLKAISTLMAKASIVKRPEAEPPRHGAPAPPPAAAA